MNRYRLSGDRRPWEAALIVLFIVVFCAASVQAAGPNHWRSVGIGDCPGRDVAGSSGPNPDPSKCTDAFRGQTAVCWNQGCTYKNVAVDSCRGGASPGRMYVCEGPPAQPVHIGNWRSVGIGDCPGRDVAGSSGPNPDPAKCTDAFQGQTAVCWDRNCTYKNVAVDSCRGGASPGRMYVCDARPAQRANIGNWQSAGIGDCPGRDVAGSSGPNPDPSKCTDAFRGQTAVCWDRNCTYKNVATESCRGGASPGRMYTCAAPARTKGPGPSPDMVLFDNWNGYVCSTTNRVRFELRRDSFVSRIVVWSDARRDGGNLSAILNGPHGAAGIASRQGNCDTHQRQWCERIFDVSLDLSAGWYNLDLDRNSVCQNQGSRGNGFAKIYGNQR